MTKYGEVNRTFTDSFAAYFLLSSLYKEDEAILSNFIQPKITFEWENGDYYSFLDGSDLRCKTAFNNKRTLKDAVSELVMDGFFLDNLADNINKTAIEESLVLVNAIINGYEPFDRSEIQDNADLMRNAVGLKKKLTNILLIRNKVISESKQAEGKLDTSKMRIMNLGAIRQSSYSTYQMYGIESNPIAFTAMDGDEPFGVLVSKEAYKKLTGN